MKIHQKEKFLFFSNHTITIFSLFTYLVCDEKVKTEGGEEKGPFFPTTIFSLGPFVPAIFSAAIFS